MSDFAVRPGSFPFAPHRALGAANRALDAATTRLATGYRINRAADDPAGLIASQHLEASMRALEAESRSIERLDAVASTADGALAEISSLLVDANAAAVAAANTAGLSQAERDAYQFEIDSARQAIDRITATTAFNGQKLLDGSTTLTLAGDGGASLAIPRISAPDGSQGSLLNALTQVNTLRGRIGSFQKDTLETRLRTNASAIENIAAANSRIRDTDYAAEASALARARTLRDSSLAVLALSLKRRDNGAGFLA